jgi:hypothetical protein
MLKTRLAAYRPRLRPADIPARSGIRPVRALGRLRAAWRAEDLARPAWQGRLWTLALLVLLGGFAYKLGATHWYSDYPLILPDGREIRLPDTFTSIDHPFHIAKERATVDALRAGHLPAWFSNHQGGFPAEFYPTGGDMIVAFFYLLAFGTIPLAVVHKLTVIGVLLLPPLAYWALARRERLPLSVAVLAGLLHLFVRGNWLAGGSREAVDYGLWPDTLASYLPLFLILWGADWLRRGDRRGLILATLSATLAVYTNPRSVLGLAAAGLALGIVALSELMQARTIGLPGRVGATADAVVPPDRRARLWRALRWPPFLLLWRSGALAGLVGLLSAALLLPLRENQDLYKFTIYFRFEEIGQVWSDPTHGNGIGYTESVLPGLIALAGLGVVVGLLRRGFYTRVFAVLLPLSYLLITLVGWTWRDLPIFAQLEGQRLMPLLRPATIFLAALGAHEALRCALRLFRIRGGAMLTGVATVTVAATILLSSRVPFDDGQRGLPLDQTTNQVGFASIARAAALFTAAAGPGDKPLILGNPISWHASFWIPALTGRDVYHNDYLWFWRTTDYANQELLSDETAALGENFLRQHGLTMVLIDTERHDLLDLANTRSYLTRLDAGAAGGYAIYRVTAPPGPPNGYVIPANGTVTALAVQPEHLTATVNSDTAQEVRIIINNFPRWRAWVNGQPTPIASTPDGYIGLDIPAGEARIELRYVTSTANWVGRAGVALGMLLIVAITAGPWLRRRRRRRA